MSAIKGGQLDRLIDRSGNAGRGDREPCDRRAHGLARLTDDNRNMAARTWLQTHRRIAGRGLGGARRVIVMVALPRNARRMVVVYRGVALRMPSVLRAPGFADLSGHGRSCDNERHDQREQSSSHPVLSIPTHHRNVCAHIGRVAAVSSFDVLPSRMRALDSRQRSQHTHTGPGRMRPRSKRASFDTSNRTAHAAAAAISPDASTESMFRDHARRQWSKRYHAHAPSKWGLAAVSSAPPPSTRSGGATTRGRCNKPSNVGGGRHWHFTAAACK